MIGFLRAVFGLFQQVAAYFNMRQTLDAGRAIERSANAVEDTKVIVAAEEAKREVRTADASVTSTDELPDDGFKRD